MNADDPFGDDTGMEDTVFQRRSRRAGPFVDGAAKSQGGDHAGGLAGGAPTAFDPDATVMMPGAGGQAHLEALMAAMEAAQAAEARAGGGAANPATPSPVPAAIPGGVGQTVSGAPGDGTGLIGDDWDEPDMVPAPSASAGSSSAGGGAPPPPVRPAPPPSIPPSAPPRDPFGAPPSPSAPPMAPKGVPPSPSAQPAPPKPASPPAPHQEPPHPEPHPAPHPAPRVGPPEHAEATLFAAAAGEPGPFSSAPPMAAAAETPRRAAIPGAYPAAEHLDDATLAGAGLNPLLGNATALLALASRLRDGPGVTDLDGLRERVIAEVRRFDQASLAAGLVPENVRMARYALCATVDDLILSTDWGASSGWAGRSLVSTIYSETWGGERFFDILGHLLARPGSNLDVLELMAVCLALGFVGKYRVMPQGQSELAEVRDNLFRTLRQVRGDFDRALSPQWRGLEIAHKPPPSSLVPLLVAAIVVVSLGILYMVLSATLTARTEAVARDLIESVPVGPPSILRPETAPPPLPTPVVAPVPGLYERLSTFLAPEIDRKQVELVRGDATVIIRLLGGGTFASATARVRHRDLPLLHRIGAALNAERGPVVVVGHTDSQPIRTAQFPSNYELSLARAAAVVEILRQDLEDPTRLRAEGAAAKDPLAGNNTREGRARNRRIEIVVPETEAEAAQRAAGIGASGPGQGTGAGGTGAGGTGAGGTGAGGGAAGRVPAPVYPEGAVSGPEPSAASGADPGDG